jgi:hypothetical protein
MSQQPFRITPALPVGAYKTYGMHSPNSTHTRSATCAEVECEQFLKGWITRVPFHSALAEFIAGKTHGRHFTETTGVGTGEREFVFPPGQQCFRASQHAVSLERPPILTVRGGDWRGSTTQTRVHATAENWVDDFATNQIAIADTRQRG